MAWAITSKLLPLPDAKTPNFNGGWAGAILFEGFANALLPISGEIRQALELTDTGLAVIKIKTIHSYSTIEVKGKVCFGALYMEILRNS